MLFHGTGPALRLEREEEDRDLVAGPVEERGDIIMRVDRSNDASLHSSLSGWYNNSLIWYVIM